MLSVSTQQSTSVSMSSPTTVAAIANAAEEPLCMLASFSACLSAPEHPSIIRQWKFSLLSNLPNASTLSCNGDFFQYYCSQKVYLCLSSLTYADILVALQSTFRLNDISFALTHTAAGSHLHKNN